MIFSQAFGHLEKEFHLKCDLSSTIRHKGEKGRQRENGLLTFLRDTLPGAYGVATGEIIPYTGSDASPQCDIIIYDHLRMPVLGRSSAVQQVPLEAVYAVIECKSIVDSTAIKDAEEKFSKIRSLPRCESKARLKKGTTRGPHCILFGYKFSTTTDRCVEFASNCLPVDNTQVVVLDKGCTLWVTDRGKGPYCVWINATETSRNLYETLVFFYVSLLQNLQDTDLGTPDYISTFLGGN
jgi:hypothetical protein